MVWAAALIAVGRLRSLGWIARAAWAETVGLRIARRAPVVGIGALVVIWAPHTLVRPTGWMLVANVVLSLLVAVILGSIAVVTGRMAGHDAPRRRAVPTRHGVAEAPCAVARGAPIGPRRRRDHAG